MPLTVNNCENLNIGIKFFARSLIEIPWIVNFSPADVQNLWNGEGRRKDERKGNEGVFRGGPASGLISKVCALNVDVYMPHR